MIDIINAYAEADDEIVLLAGSIKVTERRLNEKVQVDQIIRYDRSSSLKRFFTWCWGALQIFNRLLFKYREYEVVYVTNPPMAYLSSLLVRNPFSMIVYDTYPDALENIGIKKNSWIHRKWSKWNKILFARASKIVTLSDGMADRLAHYVERDKIRVVPNWSSKSSFGPIPKATNPFSKQLGLENKFTVLYSGNMGYTHNIETLIEVARQMNGNDRVHFLLVGDGKKRVELQAAVRALNLQNCTFLNWQPAEMIQYSLASADLGVVTINDDTANDSVPSKTYNLLAVGAPLLCIVPEDSELSLMVTKYKNGACFQPNQVKEIVSFIDDLSSHREKRDIMALHSLEASKNYTFANAKLYL
jgi:glycosyltransferase involved in cell wall biosynthesis